MMSRDQHATPRELGICYVADERFLLPTLLAATSLRRFMPVGTARVFVFVILGGALDLDEQAAPRHNDIHVGLRPHVFDVREIEQALAARLDPATGATACANVVQLRR